VTIDGGTIDGVNMSAQAPGREIGGSAMLRSLAERTGGQSIESPGGLELKDTFAAIAEELGHQYTIAYRPTNRTRDGKWRTIQVKLSKPDVTVRTRKGYRAPKG